MEKCFPHPGIMSYKRVSMFSPMSNIHFDFRCYLCLQMEHANGRDLPRFLAGLQAASLSEGDAGIMTVQLACALHYLQTVVGIIHRDIKPQNVLVKVVENLPYPQVLLTDLGMSKIYDKEKIDSTFQLGTYMYMAPEMILNIDYDFRLDNYGLGLEIGSK